MSWMLWWNRASLAFQLRPLPPKAKMGVSSYPAIFFRMYVHMEAHMYLSSAQPTMQALFTHAHAQVLITGKTDLQTVCNCQRAQAHKRKQNSITSFSLFPSPASAYIVPSARTLNLPGKLVLFDVNIMTFGKIKSKILWPRFLLGEGMTLSQQLGKVKIADQ